MRLHILIFALYVIYSHAASIPDKKDIEKKLINAAKEVLNSEKPSENTSSEQELIDQTNNVKKVENNLRKTPQVSDIVVKIIEDDVKPEAKPDKKEENEVAPESEEATIIREKIDLKNPGPPQRTQHDNQNPENFEDAQAAVLLKTQISSTSWSDNPQYTELREQMSQLQKYLSDQIEELDQSIKNYVSNPKPTDAESTAGSVAQPASEHKTEPEKENVVKLRATLREDNQCSTSAPSNNASWGGPFGNFFSNWNQQLQKLNESVSNYINNNTLAQQNNGQSSNTGSNFLNFGNFLNQNNASNPAGAQADEPGRPNLWQNFQNFVGGFNQQQQPPAGAQADSPQPAQPAPGPIASAFQNVVNFFNPNRPNQAAAQPAPPPPPPPPPAEAGSNVVPAESKPEGEQKEKPTQNAQTQTLAQQSGPIKQMIGKNPIIQGIAGAVQRIQHAVTSPDKPREEPLKEAASETQSTKAGFYKPGHGTPAAVGDNNNVDSSSGIAEKSKPEAEDKKEIPAEQPVKEEIKVPVVEDKTQ